MGGGNKAKDHPWEYLTASGLAAVINYPLWRASAVGQSGFIVEQSTITNLLGRIVSSSGQQQAITSTMNNITVPRSLLPYLYAFAPPYKGLLATTMGMTWARATIFWGSDYGRDILKNRWGYSNSIATVVPPLIVSTFVQFVNMPLIRSTITLQDPNCHHPNVTTSMKHIYRNFGLAGLWHGTSAGVAKTVPKYCTAIVVKDFMEEYLDHPSPDSPTYETELLLRSATKSTIAGIAGAILTNPLDVIRNEMFKTNLSLKQTIQSLHSQSGYSFLIRGMGKNLVAVSIPVSCTIFFTDTLIHLTNKQKGV